MNYVNLDKTDLQHFCLLMTIFTYRKMTKDSSAKYYQNLPEDAKQQLVQYRIKYYKMKENTLLFSFRKSTSILKSN